MESPENPEEITIGTKRTFSEAMKLCCYCFGDNSPIVLSEENPMNFHLMAAKELCGVKLFKDFTLRWPDFVEFDELNQKIITKHSIEDSYRVWCLQTYQL